MIWLHQEFKEFLRLLTSNKVKYLMVGGHAVSYHGHPRSTGDLDIWVEISEDNAENLVKSIKEFGFDLPDLTVDLFLEEHRIARMGYPPLRINILTSISGVEFSSCYERKVVIEIDDFIVNILNFDDLIKNKSSTNRFKDNDDIENLINK
jgi:hypothetical protein